MDSQEERDRIWETTTKCCAIITLSTPTWLHLLPRPWPAAKQVSLLSPRRILMDLRGNIDTLTLLSILGEPLGRDNSHLAGNWRWPAAPLPCFPGSPQPTDPVPLPSCSWGFLIYFVCMAVKCNWSLKRMMRPVGEGAGSRRSGKITSISCGSARKIDDNRASCVSS